MRLGWFSRRCAAPSTDLSPVPGYYWLLLAMGSIHCWWRLRFRLCWTSLKLQPSSSSFVSTKQSTTLGYENDITTRFRVNFTSQISDRRIDAYDVAHTNHHLDLQFLLHLTCNWQVPGRFSFFQANCSALHSMHTLHHIA